MENLTKIKIIFALIITSLCIAIPIFVFDDFDFSFNNCCTGNDGGDIPCPNQDTLTFLESEGYMFGCEHAYEWGCNDYMEKHNVTLECWDNETLHCGN